MNRQVVAVAVACVAVLVLAGTAASAEDVVSVDVPFAFFVAGKEMPAGRYEIRTRGDEKTALLVENTTSGRGAVAPVLERLADTGFAESKVVFDNVEGKRYLSEVHVPAEDGFLVGIAKGKETHEVLTGRKK